MMNRDEKSQMDAIGVLKTIIEASGGEFQGKVRLYKAFYFAHLFYWRDFQDILTDYPIVKMPHGPGIDNGDELIDKMIGQGDVSVSFQLNGPYKEATYKLTSRFEIDPNEVRYQAIEKAVKFIEGKSARELSEITHENSKSWLMVNDGEEMNIYLDVLDDEEFSLIQNNLAEAKKRMAEVFG